MLLLFTTLALAAPIDARPAACAECHEPETTAWLTSRHAVAATNPVFTAAWEHWPNGWCLQCHAPAADQQIARLGRTAIPGVIHALPQVEPGPRWSDGVDCGTCHLGDGILLSAKPPSDAALASHDIRVEPKLTDERLCATCHEFSLQNHTPVWPFTKGPTPAQETITEWRASTAATSGQSCVDCHMGEHGHRFPGAHTPELVRASLHVDARVNRNGTVSATISAPGAAHRVPTGDPFRSIEFLLFTDASAGEQVGRATLRRVFKITDTTWTLLEDRSIPPESADQQAVRELELTPSAPATWWRLYYRYGDARFEADLPADEVGYVISEGPLPAKDAR